MKTKISLSLVALALLFVASTPAIAADTVLRVVVVQTDDVAWYVEQLARIFNLMFDIPTFQRP